MITAINDADPKSPDNGDGTAPGPLDVEKKDRARSMECEESIRRRIEQRTGGRIQMLEVQVVGDKVIVGGRASTYYLKQLALHGVLDVLGSGGTTQVELNVEVSGPAEIEAEATGGVLWLEW